MIMRCYLSKIRNGISVAGCLAAASAAAFTATNTDLLLGLYKAPYNDMVFNLGNVSNYFGLASGTVVPVANWNSALAKANFNNNLAQVNFALMAVTVPTPLNGTSRRTWITCSSGGANDVSTAAQALQCGEITSVGSQSAFLSALLMPGVVTNYVAVSPSDASYGSYAYTSVLVGNAPTLGGSCTFTIDQTVPGALPFYEIKTVANPRGPFPSSTQLGSFSLGLDGTLTFTAGVSGTAPSITTPPQTPVTVFVGGSTNFSVVAGGTQPLSYSWRFNSNSLGSFSSTLSLNNVQLTNAGYYDVIVSNAFGMVTSAPPALLVVVPPPVPPSITTPPQNPVTVLQGGNTNFSVVAGGTPPLSYSWRFNSNSLGSFSSTLSLNNVQLASAGYYDVIVSNAFGMATSAPPAQLRVLAAPTAGGTNHSLVRSSGQVSLPVSTIAGLLYTLQYRTNASSKGTGANWSDILPSVTGNGTTLNLPDNSASNSARFYRIRVN